MIDFIILLLVIYFGFVHGKDLKRANRDRFYFPSDTDYDNEEK